jgi:predicted esterase
MEQYQGFLPAIAASYGGDKATKPEEYKKRSAELFPEAFTMPVAFAVGGKDAIVPPDSVRRLAAKLKEMKRDVMIIDNVNGGHATSLADTMAALEFMFKTAAASPKKKGPR